MATARLKYYFTICQIVSIISYLPVGIIYLYLSVLWSATGPWAPSPRSRYEHDIRPPLQLTQSGAKIFIVSYRRTYFLSRIHQKFDFQCQLKQWKMSFFRPADNKCFSIEERMEISVTQCHSGRKGYCQNQINIYERLDLVY